MLLELERPEEARKSFEAALNSEPDHSVRPTKIIKIFLNAVQNIDILFLFSWEDLPRGKTLFPYLNRNFQKVSSSITLLVWQ